MIRRRPRAWLSAFAASIVLSLTVPPGLAGAAQEQSLQVTVAFDKPTYRSGEWIKADFTVKNVSSRRLSRVTASQPWDSPEGLVFAGNQWAEFSSDRGIDLEPGASHTVKLYGHTRRADSESVLVAGTVRDRAGMSIVEFSSAAAVTRTYGRAGGVAFADRNGNGAFDTGEELPGAPISLQYAHNRGGDHYSTTTDAKGRFSFPSIPTTRYQVVNTQVDGWTVLTQSIDVDQSGKNDNLRVRVVKSLWGVLTAEMKFTKDSYAPGDLAHVTVTLSNSGASPLTGIVAYCNREVHSHALRGLAWGDLSSWSRGVTVPPGQTKTFDVTEHVPDGAFRAGFVVAGCRFGHYGDGNFYDMPEARDTAPVPGGIGTIKGSITYYPQGPGGPAEPVAGARVVVVDERPCHVAEQLTAKDGGFEFVNLRAGPGYSLYFYPPAGWRMLDKNPVTQFWVSDGDISMTETEAGKGEGQLPALPAEAAGCRPGTTTSSKPPANDPPATDPPAGPAPQARPAGPDLANTGADDVPMLAALGVLAVLLGSGLMPATRRRDTSR